MSKFSWYDETLGTIFLIIVIVGIIGYIYDGGIAFILLLLVVGFGYWLIYDSDKKSKEPDEIKEKKKNEETKEKI